MYIHLIVLEAANWMIPVQDILINLIASLIWLLLGVLAVYLKNRLFKKMMYKRTRLKLHTKNDGYIIHSYYGNSGKVDKEAKTGMMGYPFEYISYATVITHLKSITKNVEVKVEPGPLLVSQIKDKTLDSNIIIFGGPLHNLITGYLLGMSKENHTIPFYFAPYKNKGEEGYDKASLYIDGEDEPICIPKQSDDGTYYKEDYGIIINIANPFNKKKRLISMIGCHSIGVYAAALYFTEFDKELAKHTKGKDNYIAIVKCLGDLDNIKGDPEYFDSYELDDIDPNILTDKYLKDIELKE